MAELDYEAIAKGMAMAVPFIEFLDLEIKELTPGAATVRLPERPELTNHVGSQHAGALFTLAEVASGAAFVGAFAGRMSEVVPLVRNAEIVYEKKANGPIEAAGRLGIPQAEALAKLDAEGRVEFPCQVVLTDNAGNQVATATATWH